MWNPFNVWGRPDDFGMRMIGEFNPFLYLIALLNLIGLNFSLAYYIYLISYYFFGIIGFYLLIKTLIKDKMIAYLVMLLLMFSNLSGHIFNDLLVILILIPMVWFFYFLFAFNANQTRLNFLGMVLFVMIIMTTYLPFHFATLFMIVIVGIFLFNSSEAVNFIGKTFTFIKKNIWLVILGISLILLSILPGYWWGKAAQTGDYFYAWRGGSADSLGLNLRLINKSSLIGPTSLSGLFNYLKDIDLNLFYVPISAIIFLCLGIITPIRREMVIALFICVFIFLISLGNAAPIHGWLFQHIFFFKYFRNLHFLQWVSLCSLLIFLAYQIQYLIQQFSIQSLRVKNMVFILFIHGLIFVFLFNQPDILMSSYISVFMSCIIFLMLSLNFIQKEKLLIILSLLILIQPVNVFYYMTKKYDQHQFAYAKNPYLYHESKPQFSFMRPDPNQDNRQTNGFGDVKDTSGFVEWNKFDFGLRWGHFLQTAVGREFLSNYVQNKFIAYDKTLVMGQEDQHAEFLKKYFSQLADFAIIDRDDHSRKDVTYAGMPLVLFKPNAYLKILQFDINQIVFQTNFPKEKFLVYNDSFHSDWKLNINGKPSTIYRANIAFKGFWVPAGIQKIKMVFRPGFRYWINILLLFSTVFISLFLILGLVKNIYKCFGDK